MIYRTINIFQMISAFKVNLPIPIVDKNGEYQLILMENTDNQSNTNQNLGKEAKFSMHCSTATKHT